MLTHGELFAGISGFGLGFERAGMPVSWAVEIDPTCRNVLRRHHPGTLIREDVCAVGAHNLPAVDIISFGSPCQDLSVAGRRAGFDGKRSGLFFEAVRIIRELRPTWAIWENVPGALSSNGGRDFGAALDALADAGAVDICWRVLDAQWFGVAQRRQRVFLVASFRSGTRAAQVLFEPTSCGGDSAPRRETGESVAASLTRGSASGSGVNAPGRRREDDINLVPVAFGGNNTSGPIPVAAGLNAKGGSGRMDFATETFIAFTQNTRDEVRYINGDGAISGALGAQEGMKQRTYVAQGIPDVYPTLSAYEGGALTHIPPIPVGMAVRRLTPTECERLMGFPDDWTAYGADGKPISDSARYRMLGNSIVVPVAEWIGRRMATTAAPVDAARHDRGGRRG